MYANGFFEEKRRSPASLGLVIGLHATAFVALALYGTTTFEREADNRLKIVDIKQPQIPPEVPPPPPRPDQPQPRQRDTLTAMPIETPVNTGITTPPTPPVTYQPPTTPPGPIVLAENTRVEIPPPVRRGAEVDPRFRDALQPPYPRDQEALQRVGQVRVRITIGTDGRVTAIEQISATNDSFWRATERQARSRWRFRPATVDGRPIVSTMIFNVTFRIPDA